MRTIIFYVYSLSKGGAERVLITIAEYLAIKNNVLIFTDTCDEDEYPVPKNVKRINLNNNERCFCNRIGKVFRREFRIRKNVKKNNADVIIAFSGRASIRMIIALKGLEIKKIGAIRTFPEAEFKNKISLKMANEYLGKADTLIFQTNIQVKSFNDRVKEKAVVIKNPLRESFCIERFTGTRKNEIVSVGRIDENKNHIMLIEAFQQLHSYHPELKLIIYGEGEEREKLQTIINQRNLAEFAFLPGIIADVPNIIRQAKVFVLTSEYEGIPNALMEAMALGIPVISTDCIGGGAAELIQDGHNGFLIPMNDVTILVEKLKLLIENDKISNYLGENASAIQNILGTEKICEQWEQCIIDICEK